MHSIHIIFHCLHLREIRGERASLRLLPVQAVPSMDGKEVGLTLRSVVWTYCIVWQGVKLSLSILEG